MSTRFEFRISVSSSQRTPLIVKRSDYVALQCLVYHFVRAHLRELNAHRNFAICAKRRVPATMSALSFHRSFVRSPSVCGKNKLALTCKLRFVSKYGETAKIVEDGARGTDSFFYLSQHRCTFKTVLIKQFYARDDGSHSRKVTLS